MSHSVSWDAADASSAVDSEWRRRRRQFQAARRHTRLVRRLRVALPVAGAAAVVGLFVVTRLSLPGNVDLSVARLSVTRNAIIMDSPRLTGFDANNRGYAVTADRAIQALGNPNAVQLQAITATLTVPGRGATTVGAESGDYDNAAGRLALHGGVVVDSPDGYSLRLTDVQIDMKAGTMSSLNPVTIIYESSQTTGRSMSVTKGGQVIVLDGVRSTLLPPKRSARAAAADQPAAPPAPAPADMAKQPE